MSGELQRGARMSRSSERTMPGGERDSWRRSSERPVRGGERDSWRRFGVGDPAAFAELYRTHHRDVHRYCHSLLQDEEDARDAAQGTWTAIWTAPGAARRDVPLRPWLFRVAHNQAVDILRRRHRHHPLAGVDLPAPGGVEGDVELRDRLATLHADLAALPERQREALLLRELCGLGHEEIGAMLQITAAGAKQTIYEARRALVEAEGGRSMACGLAQRAISDGDGRVRRGRRLRAHLRDCAACRDFADAIAHKGDALRGLLPAPAATGLLAALTRAGSSGSSGGLAAVGGKLGASVAIKVAAAAAIVAVGVGSRHEIAGAVHGRPAPSPEATHRPTPSSGATAGASTGNADHRATLISAAAHERTPVSPPSARPGGAPTGTHDGPGPAPPGIASMADAATQTAPTTPGSNGAAARTTTAGPDTSPAATASPGRSADAPGHTKTPGASASPGHTTPPSATATPGNSADAPGHTKTPGASASPGHTNSPSATATPGNSANAPGHTKAPNIDDSPGAAAATPAATAAPGNAAGAPGHDKAPPATAPSDPAPASPEAPTATPTTTAAAPASAVGHGAAARETAPGHSAT